MSNSYFAFKQFRIEQDQCAMKVSTDACILGAWTPVPSGAARVLDIGAGTGLLSLMIAQRAPASRITGLERNDRAAAQGAENAAASPFSDRVQIIQADALAWEERHQYELIICNPPFFRHSLLGPDKARNAARHSGELNPESLAAIIRRHLMPDGTASVIWPAIEFGLFREAAEGEGLQMQHELSIRDRPDGRINRIAGIFGSRQSACRREALSIRNNDGSYTSDFVRLLSPFYLAL